MIFEQKEETWRDKYALTSQIDEKQKWQEENQKNLTKREQWKIKLEDRLRKFKKKNSPEFGLNLNKWHLNSPLLAELRILEE